MDDPARPRILVVDDDPLVRRIVRSTLELDHDVVTAEDTGVNPVTPALIDFLDRNRQ